MRSGSYWGWLTGLMTDPHFRFLSPGVSGSAGKERVSRGSPPGGGLLQQQGYSAQSDQWVPVLKAVWSLKLLSQHWMHLNCLVVVFRKVKGTTFCISPGRTNFTWRNWPSNILKTHWITLRRFTDFPKGNSLTHLEDIIHLPARQSLSHLKETHWSILRNSPIHMHTYSHAGESQIHLLETECVTC